MTVRLETLPPSRAAGWRRAVWRIWAVSAPFVFAGCSTLFDGELGAIRCEQEGVYGPPACRQGETCVQGACVSVGAPIGSSCQGDGDCREPWRCLNPADFGQAGEPFCSELCCAATECGPPAAGLVCWSPPGGGGSLCWPAEAIGRQSPGEGRSGEGCGAGGDCRSGVCDGGRCIDGCCDGSFCPSDELCRIKNSPLAEGESWTCGKPPTNIPPVETCNTIDDCATAKCVPVEEDIAICAAPCCSSDDCGSIIAQGMKQPVACTQVEGLRACAALVPTTAIGSVGTACSSDGQCRSGWCVDDGQGGYCTDMCCTDVSCGDVSAFSCEPRPAGDSWALRCVRK